MLHQSNEAQHAQQQKQKLRPDSISVISVSTCEIAQNCVETAQKVRLVDSSTESEVCKSTHNCLTET